MTLKRDNKLHLKQLPGLWHVVEAQSRDGDVRFPLTPEADASCPRLGVRRLVTIPQAGE